MTVPVKKLYADDLLNPLLYAIGVPGGAIEAKEELRAGDEPRRHTVVPPAR
jgi:hypothetical protein